ncbi:hypothetical protein BDR22DRAFT_852583 [Usnea florida]
MVSAEASRVLLHYLTINPRSSANSNKDHTLENVRANPNMAEAFLNQMLLDPNNVQPNGDCVICMEETGKANRETGSVELQLRLQCSHVIGSECLYTWLSEHNTCPICRREVFPRQLRAPHGMWPDGESVSESESESDSDFDDDFDEEQRSDEEERSDEEQNRWDYYDSYGFPRAQDRENLEEAVSEDAPAGVLEQDQEVSQEVVSGLVADDAPGESLEQHQESHEERLSNGTPGYVLGHEQAPLDATVPSHRLDDPLGQNEEMVGAVVSNNTPEHAVDVDLSIDEKDKFETADDQDSDSGGEETI